MKMNLQLIADFFGWMLLINIILLIIGYLKLTVFKNFTKMVMVHLFGEQSNALYGSIPGALVNYEILIVVFNLTPYLSLRLMM